MARFCKIFYLLLFLSVSLTARNDNPSINSPKEQSPMGQAGQSIKFEHLSVDDGLSNNIVYSIIQDSRGFMWFGTDDGLNKYDGYNFTVYKHNAHDSLSISENWIHSLQESHYGGKHVLWIGTRNGGLNKLDLETEKFTHFRNDPKDPQSLSNDWVSSICEDSFGELWIGTNRGINKFNRETNKFVRYLHDPKDPTSLSNNKECTIYESITDKDSILWVGTAHGGLNKFDRKTKKFIHYKHDRHNPNSLSHNLINDLFADTSGILWIATNQGGLNKFNIKTGQFKSFQYDPNNSNSISSNMGSTIFEGKFQRKNVLWVATLNGLDKLDLETERFTHYKHMPSNPTSLCDNRIWQMYKDKTGMIWIGTYGGGLNKFDPGRQRFVHIQHEIGNPNSLSHKVIMSITESKYYGSNVFWIGTKDGGLNKYDMNTGSFIHYRYDPDNANSLSSDLVFTLLESQFQGRNELWIGTLNGLNKFDLKTKKFTRYPHVHNDSNSISNNVIRSIFEDNSGILWIGIRDGGLNRFDRSTGKFHRKTFYIGEVLSIIKDNKGTLWAGTSRGLARYNSNTDDFTHFLHDPNDPYSLSHNQVLVIYEDKFSRIWIGTKDGINLYNSETNNFTRFKVKDGLPNGVINGILEDGFGNLWLSTNHGISKFNPEQKSFRNFNIHDGLQSNQFMHKAACLSKRGEMLFGGVNGFNVFNPDNISDNLHIPNVYITDFQIFNKSVRIKTGGKVRDNETYFLSKHISAVKEIELSYRENVFSFEFAALDYHRPQKNQYAYKMEGVDPDWVYTDASRRYATYTQLDPGEYIFRVKGSNNDGLWNEEGTSLKVNITPPWWSTNLAYAFYFLLLSTIVIGIWRAQLKRIRLGQQLKMEHFEAEKLREVDKLKTRFFANISHEFRTPLTLIKGPVKQILESEIADNLKEKCKIVLRNSDRLLGLINQILDLSKLESGEIKLQVAETDIIKYFKGMVLSFSSLAETKKVKLKFTSSENSLMGYIDRDKLEKIVTNLLSNAFKFTPEGGRVEVEVLLTPLPSASPLSKGGTRGVKISISNSGKGIPPDQLNKIFDRFYQADDNYKKDSEGTGIGLALTKELVEVCHGEISVESKMIAQNEIGAQPPQSPLKKGEAETIFTVKLPIVRECFKEDEIVETSEIDSLLKKSLSRARPGRVRGKSTSFEDINESEGNVPKSKHSKSIPLLLIVEDNPDVTTYICSFMENDYRIITAENGKIGLKNVIDKYPDLVISDVMMPEMDGFELCQKIKSDERISHIPVILLTAKADLNSKIEGLEFGADDYINKPFEATELKARSRNLINQRKRLREKFARLVELQPNEITATTIDEEFLKRLVTIFETHISESDFSTEQCAKEVGMSRSSLNRKLKALTNNSTHEFISTLRLKRAAQLLKKASGTVAEVAYSVGFNNTSHFAKAFRQYYGQSPSDFINKNNNTK